MSTETNIANLPSPEVANLFAKSHEASLKKRATRMESLAASKRYRAMIGVLSGLSLAASVGVEKYATGNPGTGETTTVQVKGYDPALGYDNAWQMANRLRTQHLISDSPAEFVEELSSKIPQDASHPNGVGSLQPGEKVVISNGHVKGFKEAG